MRNRIIFSLSRLSTLSLLFLTLVLGPVHVRGGSIGESAGARKKGNLESSPNTVPAATVFLWPDPAYADLPVRGSASFFDSGGNFEGSSTYRWLVNGSGLTTGIVPQTLLLPMDGSLSSTDGQVPSVKSSDLSFSGGRFGQAVHFSRAANSRLAYPTPGNINTNEGSIEMWVQLAQDSNSLGTGNYHPRLFSTMINPENQLFIEINSGRITITSRNQGNYIGTWPDPPGWHAGEWHHVTATWSASSNRQAIYYDCVLVGETNFPTLTGSASQFYLGSAETVDSLDGNLDDIRLSRRALSAEEEGATCTRNKPAPNDEVVLLPSQYQIGDQITFELTPCNAAGGCGTPTTISTTVTIPPLGSLQPPSGILFEGTTSVNLELSTTAPANCRWGSQAQTAYAVMPNTFSQGQGTTLHRTSVSGLTDLADRWFYVRCADLATRRDPDSVERSAHIRVLGPTAANFPQIANLWGTYDPKLGSGFYASYDLFVPASWNHQGNQAFVIRALNPRAKILLTGNATYGWPALDPLTNEWMNSKPGDPGYNCLLRDSHGNLIKTSDADHPMYNLTVVYCRNVIAQRNISTFLSPRPDQGANLAYDGLYWDRLNTSISWLSNAIDSNQDGIADDPVVLDEAYKAGIEDFLTQIRTALPQAILVGNEAPQELSPWLNGRVYEWHLASLLDGIKKDLEWNEVFNDYQAWSGLGYLPHTTLMMSSPEALYAQKYANPDLVPPAVMDESEASYRRMRYGLATALMGNGLFAYDYGPYGHGTPWWYDEFGFQAGVSTSRFLPPTGYLGQPTGAPALVVDHLNTPNLLVNGDFQNNLTGWSLWVNTALGASATSSIDPGGGANQTAAARIVISSAATVPAVEFRQAGISITSGQSYTLSFWAKSSVTRTIVIDLKKNPDGVNYGFNSIKVTLTPQWQHFHIAGVAIVTAGDGKLEFLMGDKTGEVWMDDIQLQAGALGVWSRQFEHGLAVVNSTSEVQAVVLQKPYCHINGNQASLFETRVDDDAAAASPGWTILNANANQFGATVHSAPGGSLKSIVYSPNLAYAGNYELLAWVAPAAGQSSTVSVTIHSAGGDVPVTLDESAGQPGWRSLGTFAFDAGMNGFARVTATGSGNVVADAFKWVNSKRYNDGSQTNQVTLQPQDGIILLSSCEATRPSIYLPIIIRH